MPLHRISASPHQGCTHVLFEMRCSSIKVLSGRWVKWVAFEIDCVQVALDRAAKLIGRLAYNRAVKDAVRDAQVPFSHIHPCLLFCFSCSRNVWLNTLSIAPPFCCKYSSRTLIFIGFPSLASLFCAGCLTIKVSHAWCRASVRW